jgi:LPXTG-motif cell wall-anchored protein
MLAPFEYVSLPINILWGFLFWHEIPTWMTLAGAALTLLSGLYVLYRERK